MQPYWVGKGGVVKRVDSSLCGVEQAALVASDITLCDAVFVLLRVTVGNESECSGKGHCQQTGDSDAISQRAPAFGWFVHQSSPPLITSPRLIGDASPNRTKAPSGLHRCHRVSAGKQEPHLCERGEVTDVDALLKREVQAQSWLAVMNHTHWSHQPSTRNGTHTHCSHLPPENTPVKSS